MANAALSDPIFHDADAARAHFEKLRWPEGRTCPHCGVIGDEFSTLLKGKSHRAGLYKCKECMEPFTATIRTVYEDSKVPLNKWLLATHLMCASKKGISALQLQRELALGSYRTAWFMAHRIREAMIGTNDAPLGGEGKIVEAKDFENVIERLRLFGGKQIGFTLKVERARNERLQKEHEARSTPPNRLLGLLGQSSERPKSPPKTSPTKPLK